MRRSLVILISVLALLVAFLLGSFLSKASSGDLAILRIEGVLYDAEPFLRQIEKLRKSDGVKAIVLRIDSPGGSVGASQEIHEAIERISEVKTVVASLGPVAASGGYYVALPAKKILASAGSITGSIGVRMEYVNLEELLAWIRVRPETLKSGRWKDVGSPTRPMTAEERHFLEEILKKMHEQFRSAVAKGRNLTPQVVAELSEGQVFTGEEALSKGLIDGLGNLDKAIQTAAELAGIKGEPEVFYPSREYDNFVDRFWGGAQRAAMSFLYQASFPRVVVSY